MTNPSNISDDADFLLSLVPFLDAHHVRTDRIEAIANRLRIMPTPDEIIRALDEMIERGPRESDRTSFGHGVVAGIERAKSEISYLAMQSTLLKEG